MASERCAHDELAVTILAARGPHRRDALKAETMQSIARGPHRRDALKAETMQSIQRDRGASLPRGEFPCPLANYS